MNFTKNVISFKDTRSYDRLISDYLENNSFLRSFYAFEDTPEGIRERLESYQNPRLDRVLLMKTLHNQYGLSGISHIHEMVKNNINLIGEKNTFTISTGHQLNLFSGPLYVIYKLITAIRITQKMKDLMPSYNFVPLYWMATEDHDIDEITSINLYGKNIKFQTDWKGIAGKLPLTGIDAVIEELKKLFGSSKFGNELIALMEEAYLKNITLGDATRVWINNLMGKYGLVILDGNDAALKEKFSDIILDELINQTTQEITQKTIQRLETNYPTQAPPREINLFYIGVEKRERIIRENNKIKILNTDLYFSDDSIKKEIVNNPEKFSPNVLLRPLYQESILPNIAYVGGPSEIAYWLELKDLFDKFNVPYPVLFLRNCGLLINHAASEKLKRFSIADHDIFLSADELIRKFIHNTNEEPVDFSDLSSAVNDLFLQLKERISKVDPTLNGYVEAENQKVKTFLTSLDEKILRLNKKKKETEINQIRKIKENLFPNGNLQEREESMLPSYLNYGSEFFEMLLHGMDPFEKQFYLLKESDPKHAELTQ